MRHILLALVLMTPIGCFGQYVNAGFTAATSVTPIARVQEAHNNSNTSIAIGSGQGWASTGSGHAIVCVVNTYSNGAAPTITDNKSQTYTKDLDLLEAGNHGRHTYFSKLNSQSAVTSITITPSSYASASCREYSGIATSSAYDTGSASIYYSNKLSASSISTSGWVTTTGTRELLLGTISNFVSASEGYGYAGCPWTSGVDMSYSAAGIDTYVEEGLNVGASIHQAMFTVTGNHSELTSMVAYKGVSSSTASIALPVYSVVTGAGGTNGNTMSAATLTAGTYGGLGTIAGTWTTWGTNYTGLTYTNSFMVPFTSSPTACGTTLAPTQWLGFAFDLTQTNHTGPDMAFNLSVMPASVSYGRYWAVTGSASSITSVPVDMVGWLASGNDYWMEALENNSGTQILFIMEAKTGDTTTINVSANELYYTSSQYNAGGTHSAKLYDCGSNLTPSTPPSCSLMGTLTAGATGTNNVSAVGIAGRQDAHTPSNTTNSLLSGPVMVAPGTTYPLGP